MKLAHEAKKPLPANKNGPRKVSTKAPGNHQMARKVDSQGPTLRARPV